MKKAILVFVSLFVLSTINFAQVKDYELGADRLSGRSNYSGGYYNYSDPTTINIKVAVWGFVSHPGRYFVPINTTVTDLLSLAGGPTDDAHTDQLRIYRVLEDGTNKLYQFDYDDLMWEDELENNKRKIPDLKATDILVVPGSQRLYLRDWIMITLSVVSTLISLTTLLVVTSQ
ncbi:MAG: SLBB domain-containing protein [Bacteroidota bacterium]